MEVSIRRATAEDYDALCELLDEVDALHRDNLPHIFQKPDGPVRAYDYYAGLIADENVALLVAETGKRLAGFAHAVLMDTRAAPVFVPGRYAVVDGIGVRSECQNHGIGHMLMDRVVAWATDKGATSIQISHRRPASGKLAVGIRTSSWTSIGGRLSNRTSPAASVTP